METRNNTTPGVYVIPTEMWKETKKKELKCLWILNKINSDIYISRRNGKTIFFIFLKKSKVIILAVIEEFVYIGWWAGILPGILLGSLSYWLLKSKII